MNRNNERQLVMKDILYEEAMRNANKIRINYKLSYPVQIDSVIKAEGVEIVNKVLPLDFDGCYLRIGNTKPTIILNINNAIPKGRIRYTACHEFYYHILSGEDKSLGIEMFKDNGSNKTMIERACDIFSANLLMPEDIVREIY